MFTISKYFTYEAAHRIYNQNLKMFCGTNFELENAKEKCKNWHGHSFKVEVALSGEELTNDMIIDYSYLKKFKEEYIDPLDHKLVIYKDDPLYKDYLVNFMSNSPSEHSDSFVVMDFNPTAERMAEYFYNKLNKMLGIVSQINDIKVEYVRVYETATSMAEYKK